MLKFLQMFVPPLWLTLLVIACIAMFLGGFLAGSSVALGIVWGCTLITGTGLTFAFVLLILMLRSFPEDEKDMMNNACNAAAREFLWPIVIVMLMTYSIAATVAACGIQLDPLPMFITSIIWILAVTIVVTLWHFRRAHEYVSRRSRARKKDAFT